MNSLSLRTLRGQLLREVITLLLFAGLMLQSATAVAPDWWSTRSALMPDADSDDFAVANLGQLKNLAQKAAQEMNDSFPGGAGTALNAMIDAWTAPPATSVSRDDYAALTLGQLKAIAKPFYDRLAAMGARPVNTYPWTGTDADDYSLANLGQVKKVFAFPVPPLVQLATQTGVPSAPLLAAVQAWQNISMDQRAEDATLDDLDGDGISNLQEYLMGTPLFDPADIDGDRIPNAVEDLYPGILSKSRFADAVEDYDGDGVMNFEEIQLGLSLSAASSDRSDGLSDAQVLATHLKQTLPGTVREMAQRQLWDYSLSYLIDFEYDDGLLTGHPEWQSQEDANANGLPDGWEAYIAAYVPPVTRATYADCDGDHMPDTWEYRYQLDLRDGGDAGYDLFYSVYVPQSPVAPNPDDYSAEDYVAALAQYQIELAYYTPQQAFMVQMDPDLDRLCNLREYYLGSNPRLADTNGDGTADETAVLAGNDPSGGGANLGKEALADDDGDGIPNAQELKLGINPSQSNADQDQDNDGFSDVEEALAGSNIFDSGSRCGPAILMRSKDYGYGASTSTSTNSDGQKVISQYFQGYAINSYGAYLFPYTSQTGSGSLDLDGLASSVRSTFESAPFGGPSMPPSPQIYFGSNTPLPIYDTTFINGSDPGNMENKSWGSAAEFSIIGATVPNPPPVAWTRIYQVSKYTGVAVPNQFESDLTDGAVVGILVFSQTSAGVQRIDYLGGETAAIKVTAQNKSVVIMPPQVANQAISFRLTPLQISLKVDTNRDGQIDEKDNFGKDQWIKERGAIYAVNFDRDGDNKKENDENLKLPDGTALPLPDAALWWRNADQPEFEDWEIEANNGNNDVDDITPLKIAPIPGLPANAKIYLKVKEEEDMRAVHVFKKRAKGEKAIWGGVLTEGRPWTDGDEEKTDIEITKWINENSVGFEETRATPGQGDFEFGIEGIMFRGMQVVGGSLPSNSGKFSGLVEIALEIETGGIRSQTDSVAMKVAPWLMVDQSRLAQATYVAQNQLANLPKRHDLANSPGQFIQDQTEFGYTQAPGGQIQKTAFIVPAPVTRDFDGRPWWLFTDYLGADKGVFGISNDSLLGANNYGGNLELYPPDQEFPLGRILYGTNMVDFMKSFFVAQEVQLPIGASIDGQETGGVNLSYLD